jgi:hypothetical protein
VFNRGTLPPNQGEAMTEETRTLFVVPAETLKDRFPSVDDVVCELYRGYVDDRGNAHRIVQMRPPTIDDEIRRDRELSAIKASRNPSRSAEAESQNLAMLLLIKQCIVKWGNLQIVKEEHLRSLSRSDSRRLIGAFYDLETAEDSMFLERTTNGVGRQEEQPTEAGNELSATSAN